MSSECRLCKSKAELTYEHIIPKHFNDASSMMISGINSTSIFNTKMIHGKGYKEKLTCKICNGNVLGFYDNKAKIITEKILVEPLLRHDDFYIVTISEADQFYLSKFLLSILWRSTISDYCDESLGKYEPVIRDLLLHKSKPLPNSLNCYWVEHIKNPMGDEFGSMNSVTKGRENNITYYQILINKWAFYVKVDQRKSNLENYVDNTGYDINMILNRANNIVIKEIDKTTDIIKIDIFGIREKIRRMKLESAAKSRSRRLCDETH